MRKSTKKVLALMIVLLLVLIGIIVYLACTDKKIANSQSEANQVQGLESMGQTVIQEEASKTEEPETTTAPEPVQPTIVDLPNEKEVRLYIIDFASHTGSLVTDYSGVWSTDYDINTFEAINSDQQTITYDDYYSLHESYWNSVDTQTSYKIGYQLSFDVAGVHKVITILQPSDISGNPDLFMGDVANEEVTGYLGVWVYNDIGQSEFYQHLTQEEMTPDTLMTSIKLRPTPQSDQISNLKLMTFSYSSAQEFDSAGNYIGTHGYEISINRQ